MIKSRLKVLIAEEESTTRQSLTYDKLAEQTGLSKDTVNRLARNDTVRIDFSTLNALCTRFNCQVGDLLLFVPDGTSDKGAPQ